MKSSVNKKWMMGKIPIGSCLVIQKEYCANLFLKEDVVLKILTCIGAGYIAQLIKGSHPGFKTGYNLVTHELVDKILADGLAFVENGLDRATRRINDNETLHEPK